MARGFRYFLLEFKRGLILIKDTIFNQLIALLTIMLLAFLIASIFLQSQLVNRMDIGLVIPKSEGETRLIMGLVAGMEGLSSYVRFREFTEEEALLRLKERELAAVVSIPEKFYEHMYYGDSIPASVYFPQDSSLDSEVFKELIRSGISLVQISEAGIFASLEISLANEGRLEGDDLVNHILDKLALEVLSRGDSFKREILYPFGRMDIKDFYLLAFNLIIILSFGINFIYIYREKEGGVEEKLKKGGMTSWRIGLIRVLVMTSLLYIAQIAIYVLIKVFLKGPLGLSLGALSPLKILLFFPLLFSISLYFHYIFMLTHRSIDGLFSFLTINLILLIISGVIIPNSYLADGFKALGRFLPMAFWHKYYMGLFYGGLELGALIGVLIMMGVGVFGLWLEF